MGSRVSVAVRSGWIGIVVVAAGVMVAPGAQAGDVVRPAAPWVECDPTDGACDVDGDRIPDEVEELVCGSATCATGREDRDGDGLADWVEFQATGDVIGVDPTADADADGIPDFAERIVCGTERCSTGREDVDADGIGDWAEVVICGDTTCADGTEDYDGDGTLDATELAACVTYGRGDGWLATTGAKIGLGVVLAAVLVGAGVGLRWWTRRTGASVTELDAAAL